MRKHTHACQSNTSKQQFKMIDELSTSGHRHTTELRLQMRRECSRWKIVCEFCDVQIERFFTSSVVSASDITLLCCNSSADNTIRRSVGRIRRRKPCPKIYSSVTQATQSHHPKFKKEQKKQNTRYQVIFGCRHQVTSSVQCQWLVRHISGWVAAMLTFRSHMCILIYSIIHKNIWVLSGLMMQRVRIRSRRRMNAKLRRLVSARRRAQTLHGTMNAEKRQQRTRDVNYQEQ